MPALFYLLYPVKAKRTVRTLGISQGSGQSGTGGAPLTLHEPPSGQLRGADLWSVRTWANTTIIVRGEIGIETNSTTVTDLHRDCVGPAPLMKTRFANLTQ